MTDSNSYEPRKKAVGLTRKPFSEVADQLKESCASDGVAVHEREANRFAQEMLIPPGEYAKLRERATLGLTRAAVQAFADEAGVAPGIVVGRLQHDELLRFDRLNDLKARLELPRL